MVSLSSHSDSIPGTAFVANIGEFLALHTADMPQKDDLCGAFCVSLGLRAAGVTPLGGGLLDQDAVALAAGSTVSVEPVPSSLPPGASSRRDYRLAIPRVADASVSGTTAGGLVRAVAEVTGGEMVAIPLRGPWTPVTVGGLIAAATSTARPVTLLANVATRYFWGSRPTTAELVRYLATGDTDGPPPDWDVGHFVVVLGRIDGPRGTLALLADTYPSLGHAGLYLQPLEHLAAALERRDLSEGGVLAIVAAWDADAMRRAARGLDLDEGLWENGTVEGPAAA